jgi:hypothetical protein
VEKARLNEAAGAADGSRRLRFETLLKPVKSLSWVLMACSIVSKLPERALSDLNCWAVLLREGLHITY